MKTISRLAAALTILIYCVPAVAADVPNAATSNDTPAASQDAAREKSRLINAETLFMNRSLDSAVRELKDIIKDYPDTDTAAEAYWWLAKCHELSGSYAEALAELSAGLATNAGPDVAAKLLFEEAACRMEPANPERDLGRAIDVFKKVVALYPQSPKAAGAAYYAAVCLLGRGEYKTAADALLAFADGHPESGYASAALYKRGLALCFDGRRDEALAVFRSVRDRYPDGLYATQAQDAAELVLRAAGKRPPAFSSAYGARGEGPDRSGRLSGAASDPEGVLYVADAGNGRIRRFKTDNAGIVSGISGAVPPGSDRRALAGPSAVALGPSGKIYAADRVAGRVAAYSQDGRVTGSLAPAGRTRFNSPSGVAVDESGMVYVSDEVAGLVYVFGPDGRQARSFGQGEGRLRSPAGIAAGPRGTLLVTDGVAGRLIEYDPSGRVLKSFTAKGDYRLSEPSGVCVDAVGNVYVSDKARRSVIVFDSDLEPLCEVSGKSGAELGGPAGLAVVGTAIFVTDPVTDRIVVLK